MIHSKVRPTASWNCFDVTDKFWDNVWDAGVSFFYSGKGCRGVVFTWPEPLLIPDFYTYWNCFLFRFFGEKTFLFSVWTRENTTSTALFGIEMISPYWWPHYQLGDQHLDFVNNIFKLHQGLAKSAINFHMCYNRPFEIHRNAKLMQFILYSSEFKQIGHLTRYTVANFTKY